MAGQKKTEGKMRNEVRGLRRWVAELEAIQDQHKKMVKTLEEAERFLSSIFSSIQDGISVLDTDLNIIRVNQAIEKWYAHAMPLAGKKCYKAYHGRKKPCKICPTLQTIKSGQSAYEVVPKTGPKGVVMGWLDLYSFPLVDQNTGRMKGIIEYVRDITDLKRKEIELLMSEEKYRTITENVNVGIYRKTAGLKGKFIEANPALVKMFGHTNKEEFLQLNVADLCQNPEDQKSFNEQILKNGYVKDKELCLKKKDGTPFIASVSAVTVRDKKRKVIYYDGIIEDITERMRAEEQIKASLREKEVLLQEVHHRVKNNMQIISSLLSLQSRNLKDQAVIEMFKESQNRIRAMALVHEKLYHSTDLAKIDFSAYIRDLASHLSRSFGTDPNLILLKVDVENVYLNINTAIPCGLILNELISNALKHAFPGGRRGEIQLGLRAISDQKFLLTIKDNGVGFPENLDIHQTESFGMQVITILVYQLDGSIELERKNGTHFKIFFSELQYKTRI